MRLIDTHCHLDFPIFDAERAAILRACGECGVERILVPGVVACDWERLLQLCVAEPMLSPALGLHPCFIDQHRDEDLERLELLLQREEVVAVGEIGLDFWEGEATAERQLYFLDAQLDLARRCGLPVLLHVRKAHDRMLQRLRRQAPVRGGIVHAFSGSRQQAEQYLALGFRLGIGGALTYPRARRLRRIVAELPLQALVLETDAPDMPLCGRQGKPNRPDLLPQVLTVLMSLRQEPAEEVVEVIYANSRASLSSRGSGG